MFSRSYQPLAQDAQAASVAAANNSGDSDNNVLFDRTSFDDVNLVAAGSSNVGSDAAFNTQPPQQASSSSSSAGAAAASWRTGGSLAGPHVPPVAAAGTDGVFSNLGAVTTSQSSSSGLHSYHLAGLPSSVNNSAPKTADDLAANLPSPPSYQDAVYETTPPYFESSVIASGLAEDGDAIVEGMPVGNFFTFFVNLIVSMSFDFIGFLLTSMLATSHAAKHGSRSGLGITLIRYGLLLKSKSAEAEMLAYRNDPENFENSDQEQIAVQNEWVAYMMMLVGFIVMLRANADFVRVQRIRAAILATNDAPNV